MLRLSCLICFCVVFFAGASTQAQITTGVRPAGNYNPNPGNKPITPLLWAEDITQANQLDTYIKTGFNTIIVHVTWPPSQDGQTPVVDVKPQRDFAEAAAAKGLKIIYALPAAPYGQEGNFHISGDSGPYRQIWADWAQRAIEQLQTTPNLLGWMLPDDPRGLPFMTNTGFRRWLAGNYGGIDVLNQQWFSAFPTFNDVTISATRQIIAQWRGPGDLPTAATPDQMRSYIERAQQRPANQNFAFHPAELALANYEWDAYRALLDFWAHIIRTASPTQSVLSGRLPDYAQLLSLPPSVDISVPSLAPVWAERDIATHNPQAVSVARRGGRFDAVPMLSTMLPGAPEDLVPRLIPSWCDSMVAHGARGIAFDSWPVIAQNPALATAIRRSLRRLQRAEAAALWGKVPQATTAVVLTPLADGYTWKPAPPPKPENGEPPPVVSPPRGLFGFGEDMVAGEPSDLVYALRWGTQFGSVDFISPDELGGTYSMTSGGVLRRYSTILMPQALWVSPSMAQELANYLGNGGTVVADLGLGAWQNRGQVMGFSEALMSLFGIIPTGMQTFAFNLAAAAPHPAFRNWSTLAQNSPRQMTRGDGPEGAAFAGPLLFGELAGGTIPIARAFQYAVPIGPGGEKVKDADRIRLMRSWLSLRPVGNGNAIFAPFRLWTLWRPGYPGFDEFHGDLFEKGAAVAHLNVQPLVPAPPGTPDGAAAYPEVINHSNAVVVLNHNAAANPPYGASVDVDTDETGTAASAGMSPMASANTSQPAIVQTAGVEQFVWSNALCLFPVGGAPAPTMGRLPPVAEYSGVPGDSGFIVPPVPHPVILHTFVPAQEMRVMRLLPIRAVNPNGGPLACRVRDYSAKRIEMRVWPNASGATPTTDWKVILGPEGPVRIVLFDDQNPNSYRLLPGSKHRVAITEVSSRNQTFTTRNYVVTADAQGTLPLEIRGVSLVVEITPFEEPLTVLPSPTGEKPQPGTETAIIPGAIVAEDATPEEAAKARDAAAPKPAESNVPSADVPLVPPPPDAPTLPAPNPEDPPLFRKRYN